MPQQIPTAAQSAAGLVDTIHSIAQSHTPLEALVGKVVASPPDLKIAVNNIVLDRKNLYIDLFLLAGYFRRARGHLVSSTQLADCGCGHEHLHAIDDDYSETWITTDTLKPGDLVSLMPIKGGQQFIVLGRLVWLGETSKDPHGGD